MSKVENLKLWMHLRRQRGLPILSVKCLDSKETLSPKGPGAPLFASEKEFDGSDFAASLFRGIFMFLSHLINILVVFMLTQHGAIAVASPPLRDPTKLWEATTENVVKITTARVTLADYDLIRRDFPEVSAFSNQAIDDWLIRNTAFVSKQQAAQQSVNTPISTSAEERMAYRPREYARAHVFAIDTGGLIDAKGTGSLNPSGGSHNNGLATLGDMIREYAYEKLINAIFQRHGGFETVGSYAVIDYGFEIKHPDGGTSRAGTVLRQAHTRYHGSNVAQKHGQAAMLPHHKQREVELFLRRFGISSTMKYYGVDRINLQGSESMAVIDFGAFLVNQSFARPVYFSYTRSGQRVTVPSVINQADPNLVTAPGMNSFVQPESGL